MDYARTSNSPVATTSKPSATALTALSSVSVYRAKPSTQLCPLRPEVLIRLRCLRTETLRPSSPRVSIRSLSMESTHV